MIDHRPDWADDLLGALSGMRNGPRPLLPILEIYAGRPISDEELRDFLRHASENDSSLTQFRMKLAAWDALEEISAPGLPSETFAAPNSPQRRLQLYKILQLPRETAEILVERAPVFERPSIVISRTFVPWYTEARSARSSVYWDDYEAYLRDVKKWDAEAITSVDRTTTEVIERLSDPTRAEAKQTKGLVVGYVQSGKTANFTGVVAKAVDAGYRLIIVLTGTIEILRAQTQRRMDMELMGVENILAGQDITNHEVVKELDYQQDKDWLERRFVSHGAALEQKGVVHISRVTTHRDDYIRLPQGLSRLKFQRSDKSRPLNDEVNLFNSDAYVAVIKKNRAPLEKLIKDLTPLKNDLAQLPVLIIDDESDQASVDTTNPAKFDKETATDRRRTAINKLITEVLALCPRAQYVGYTATPFANVFVDPSDERDLFPADFVLSLSRPPGYMGVQEFHDIGKRWDDEPKSVSSSNEMAHVRSIKGDPELSPDLHRQEMQEALDSWVLSGAVKKFRETRSDYQFRHHTMLIHESVSRTRHSEAADIVRRVWGTSGFTSAAGLTRLKALFEADFEPVMRHRADGAPQPRSFEELRPFVAMAIQEMTVDGDPVLVVNSDKEIQDNQKKLDFETDKVWRVLVGGTQLSRGFTVEGLTTSYFRRKAGQADTLMQAGRWFGFRPGYKDLVRLYIRRDSGADLYEAFEALLFDEEALRGELRQYEGFDETGLPLVEPRQIPPLVSQHLPWLRPTARNKMWNAVIDSKATAGGIQDRYGVPPRGAAGNRSNLEKVGIPLLQRAIFESDLEYLLADGTSGLVRAKIGTLSAEEFLSMFDALLWHPRYDQVIQPFRTFLGRATSDQRIREWAVVWPQPSRPSGTLLIDGTSAPVVKRNRRPDRIDFVGSDRKHSEAAMRIARGEDVEGLPGEDGRGVALVYLVDDRADPMAELSADNVIPLISLGAPSSSTPRKHDLIQWTVRVESMADEPVIDVANDSS